MKSNFKVTTKPLSYFLGLEISQKEDGSIYIDQKNYIQRILNKFNMECSKAVPTPIMTNKSQDKTIEEKEEIKFPYQKAAGALMYLMVSTRPDISYAVGVVSRSLEELSAENVTQVKRIFRYLRGTENLGIVYRQEENSGMLEGYSDADLGCDMDTGRSTTGLVSKYAGGPISWLSCRLVLPFPLQRLSWLLLAKEAVNLFG